MCAAVASFILSAMSFRDFMQIDLAIRNRYLENARWQGNGMCIMERPESSKLWYLDTFYVNGLHFEGLYKRVLN